MRFARARRSRKLYVAVLILSGNPGVEGSSDRGIGEHDPLVMAT